MMRLKANEEVLQEAENIIDGLYSPVDRFMAKEEIESVLERMRLLDGRPWSMPIVLDVNKKEAEMIGGEKKLLLVDEEGHDRFNLEGVGVYRYNKKRLAYGLFKTDEDNHPGVAKVMGAREYFVSGGLSRASSGIKNFGTDFYFSPQETRKLFRERGWETVVAFQTRNAPHRSHEHLQLTALKVTDGLFVNPIIGSKKKGDFKDEFILGAYKILVNSSGLKDKMMLGTFHTFMRYAGPKEAIFHALVRKNFGCSHMIIGRDHAGVGDYYGTYEAQEIFDNFSEEELGIKILKYDNAFYCRGCGEVVFENECTHDKSLRVFVSGTELREKLSKGKKIPVGFMRKEVAQYLLNHKDSLFV